MTRQSFISRDSINYMVKFTQPDFINTQLQLIDRVMQWTERFAGRGFGAETRVLEIGVGSGEMACFLGQRYQVAGLEPCSLIMEHIHKKARDRNVLIDLREGAAEDVPFAFVGLKFDIILMLNVLEHVKDYKRALRNVFEHLAPGGIFVLSTANKFKFIQGEYNIPFCYSYLPNCWRYAIRRWCQGDDIMEHGIDYHEFIPWQIKRELEGIGFVRVEDLLEIVKEEDVRNKRLYQLRCLKRNFMLAFLYRLFVADVFFFCKK